MKTRGLVLLALVASAGGRAFGQCDTADPNFSSFGFTPTAINTTAAAQTVTCTIAVTDALAGANSVGCQFQSPSFTKLLSCTATTPTSGTPQNGVFSCNVTFPRYSEAGVWKANLSATDAVGNDVMLQWFFFPVGFPTDLTVTSDPDAAAPGLTDLALVPTAVTVSAAAQNVTCNMTVTDAKSGVGTATCFLSSPDAEQARGCTANAPTSGTRNSGVFSCTTSIPRYSDAGTWAGGVFLVDQAGNFGQFMPGDTLAVTSVPEDITAPSQVSFDFNPKTVDTGSGPKSVTCTMAVADSPAGVDSATCTFDYTDPGSGETYSQGCTSITPSAGTRNNGTFTCNATLPRYTPGGSWSSAASYVDLVGNQVELASALLLNVGCATPEAETTCRFDTKTNLAWNAVAGATRYNLYRGALAGLIDGNLDHLPDGGYGTCQNARDPNLTDLVFADTDVPAASQGYFYLVGYTAGGVQKGLGANTFGLPRNPTPCP
ncbi:MAG TPA: hypothetical protein VFO11_14050 [Candidatus Polarisedimenticolaceae bacterium]|nr:hypothetical protein [Candidatus Polarisedimenticolaceae bacterium]